MENLILENFKNGNTVEVYVKGSPFPLEGRYVKCNRKAILLKSESGKKIVLAMDSVLMIKLVATTVAKPGRERPVFVPGKVFTPSRPVEENEPADYTPSPVAAEETENQSPVIGDTENEAPAEASSADNVEASDDEEEKDADQGSDLFRLPSERPQIKILGSIDLEPVRKRYRKDEPVKLPQVKLADNIEDTEMPLMGVLKSIGPIYGYIKMPEGPDLYCNRGEFIFLPGEEARLEPGMPVVFSKGSNWMGPMAKCVHRPYTIGEHLDLIEHVVDTDIRNARLLASQLTDSFPGERSVADLLEEFPQLL